MKKRFCHECGTDAALDATFCEECGAELRPFAGTQTQSSPRVPDAPTPRPSAPAAHSPINKRMLAVVGVALATLATAGGAAWFALAPKPATESDLRAAANAWLQTAGATQPNRPCLQNFDYRANPVLVNPTDSATQEWLAVLVKAGIYAEPTEVETGNPWQPVKLRYTKGSAATQHLRDGQLCAASQMEVSQVNFDAKTETKHGELRVLAGTVGLVWQDRAQWSQEEPLKRAFDSRFSERKESLLWVHDKDSWRVASDDERNRLRREAIELTQGRSKHIEKTEGFSFGRFFSGLLSFGDSPEKTLERFFRSLERGNTQEASDLLYSSQIPKEKLATLLAASSAEISGYGGIKRIESTDLGGDDENRRLRSLITYNNGRSETKITALLKVDGRWLLNMNQ